MRNRQDERHASKTPEQRVTRLHSRQGINNKRDMLLRHQNRGYPGYNRWEINMILCYTRQMQNIVGRAWRSWEHSTAAIMQCSSQSVLGMGFLARIWGLLMQCTCRQRIAQVTDSQLDDIHRDQQETLYSDTQSWDWLQDWPANEKFNWQHQKLMRILSANA